MASKKSTREGLPQGEGALVVRQERSIDDGCPPEKAMDHPLVFDHLYGNARLAKPLSIGHAFIQQGIVFADHHEGWGNA